MKRLKELTIEELKDLYNKNGEFANKVYEKVYEDAMLSQEIEFKAMGAEVFDYNNHYSSFYLSTPKVYGGKAPEKVAGKLDRDYLTEENAKLYDKLCELNAIMEDAEEWDEDREEYNEMIEVCDKLADGITEQFRAYENIEDDQIDSELEAIAEDWTNMSDWETDGECVYEHITEVYK